MTRQRFELRRYNWVVTVLYDTTQRDVCEVMDRLEDMGCAWESIERSYDNLMYGGENTGLTYTNTSSRESLVVIGRASTLAQFLNTAIHECQHLVTHVCDSMGIDPLSEQAAYLAGDIAEGMHPLLEPFMCGCKRRT